MLLWIILTMMTSAAAVWLAAPFLRRPDETAVAASDLEVYRDQLAEVERERSDGAIDAGQAEAASTEIKRRLLQAARNGEAAHTSLSLGGRHLAIAGIVGLVVLGGTILYANIGRPDLPSVARAPTSLVLGDGQQGPSFRGARGGDQGVPAQSAPRPAAGTGTADTTPAPAQGPALGTVDEMIQRILERSKKEPANVETWRMLGWSYFATERYAEAVDAYAKATALEPKSAPLLASLAEAMVRTANGEVTDEAMAVVARVLAIDAKEPRARFFKGLRDEQKGNKQAALDTWLAVLADAGPQDAWAADLRPRIEALAAEIGADVAAKLPPLGTPAAGSGPGTAATGGVLGALQQRGREAPAAPAKGPTAADVKAADAMTPTDRSAMIRGMVDGLAARLEKTPRDADGWIQLIRSRKVLGDADAARAALHKALAIFNDAPPEQGRIKAAAVELGVTP